jgi:hypothetical protein
MNKTFILKLFFPIFAFCYISVLEIPESFGNNLKALDGTLFVVTKNLYADGFNPGSAPLNEILMIDILPDELGHIHQDQEFKLFSGGEYSGIVKVKSIVQFQCDSSAAIAVLPASFHLKENEFELAASSNQIKSHKNFQRSPSADEKALALKEVAEQMKRRGSKVPNPLDINIEKMAVNPKM